MRRQADGVEVQTRSGDRETFDRVVIATHSDQALRLLLDPSEREQEILGAFPYEENSTVLHTDASVLPGGGWPGPAGIIICRGSPRSGPP